MAYCILRLQKIKDLGKLNGCYKHNYRLSPVPNADPAKVKLNRELVARDSDSYVDEFHKKINSLEYYQTHKCRKNAVLAIEVVLSFSREKMESIDLEAWMADNLSWLRKTFNANADKYGDNVVSVVFHGDEEGAAHCHAIIIPIDDKGKLNCSYYLDGRKKFYELQDSYAKDVGEKHELQRGIVRSRASHQDIKRYYASVQKAIDMKLPEVRKDESIVEYRERANEYLKDYALRELYLRKKIERKVIEDRDLLQKENAKLLKRINVIEQTFGDVKVTRSKVRTIDLLHKGLKNYEDKDLCKSIQDGIAKIIEFQQDYEKRKKLEEAMIDLER